MKTEYGIPVPRGVRKDWGATSVSVEAGGPTLRQYLAPQTWGDPSACVGWFDRFERLRLIVGHYPNGRTATARIDANGKWKTTFGEVTK